MPATPKVTVFIPVHNREDYICVAVNSILAQTFEDFELVVVDDGSSDRTVEVLQRYSDRRLRVARNPENLGIPATRNHGLELARGDYIALLDSDDHAYPRRLERQVKYLDANPDIAQVGSWCSFMDSEGNMLDKVRRQPLKPDDIHAHLLFHCPVINRTVMARTAALRGLGYDTDFPRCQDYDMHCRLVTSGHRWPICPKSWSVAASIPDASPARPPTSAETARWRSTGACSPHRPRGERGRAPAAPRACPTRRATAGGRGISRVG